MKRIAWMIVGAFLLGTCAASAQSVADVARANRKQKAKQTDAVKHFDNDNLPKEDHLSVVGPPPAEEKNPETPDKPATSASAEAKPTSGAASADQAAADWKNKISGQRDKVDSLSKELDIKQREYRLRAVAMYSDAGNRLRNATQWDKEDAQYKQDIAEKQKALDEAKKTLDDMMESARKDGVSSGQLK
jgi:PBP1b-binding outer membrane lipoprotein LpoB